MRTRRLLPLLASAVALLACPGAAPASLPGGIARHTDAPVAELEIQEQDGDDNGPGRHEVLGVLAATIDANSQGTTYARGEDPGVGVLTLDQSTAAGATERIHSRNASPPTRA